MACTCGMAPHPYGATCAGQTTYLHVMDAVVDERKVEGLGRVVVFHGQADELDVAEPGLAQLQRGACRMRSRFTLPNMHTASCAHV
jgi:hypothetical protein